MYNIFQCGKIKYAISDRKLQALCMWCFALCKLKHDLSKTRGISIFTLLSTTAKSKIYQNILLLTL